MKSFVILASILAVANCSTVDGGEKKNIKRHLFSGGHHGGGIIGHQGVASYSGSHGYSSGYSSGYNGIYEGASYIKPEIHTVIKQKVPFPVPVDRPVPFPVAVPHPVHVDRPVLVKVPVVHIQKVPVVQIQKVPIYIQTPVHSHSQHNLIGLSSAHYASDSHAHFGGSYGAGISSFGASTHFGGYINGVPCDTNGIPLSGYSFGR